MSESFDALLPGPHLRPAGPPHVLRDAVRIIDARLADVLDPNAPMLCHYDGALHAEGPVWQQGRKRLIWSDVSNRRLLAWYPDGRVEVVVDRTWFMNGNAIDAEGCLVHCEHGRRCISRSDPADQTAMPRPIVTHYRGKRLNSPNDITVAADGAIWFTDPVFGIVMPSQGSLATPELDHRSVYRVDPDSGDLTRMADFEQPNGIAFSPDGGRLFVSDTSRALGDVPGCTAGAKHEVQTFDVSDDGALSNRQVFCRTEHGVPDGLAVDRRGWCWTTAADGIHVWSADSVVLGFIRTPEIATNCAFGGGDGRRLFITATRFLLSIDLRD